MFAVIVLTALAPVLAAQTSSADAAFEVASIRPHDPKERPATMSFLQSGEVRVTGMTLKNLILLVYGLRDYQIMGGPRWIDSQLYDIAAKSNPPSPRRIMEEQKARLRALLAERFALKVHRETRKASVYYLNSAKRGLKLPRADDHSKGTRGSILPWSIFISELAQRLDGPLIDNVHLEGAYFIALRYTTDDGTPSGIGVGRIDPDGSAKYGPSLSDALQQQLGLRLDPGKGQIELLVIDSVSYPSSN